MNMKGVTSRCDLKLLWFNNQDQNIYPSQKKIFFCEVRSSHKKRKKNVLLNSIAIILTWDQALFSFRFENYISAGKAQR